MSASPAELAPPSEPPLAGVRTRFAAVGATWALLWLANPGVLRADGLAPLAALALVPWALVASRPGPRAFAVEWLCAALGSIAVCAWMAKVWIGTYVFIGPVPGLYFAAGGLLLRRLARRLPLVVAVPAAWVCVDTLRQVALPPFGYGWMRLGCYLAATGPLAESARVWGTSGLSVVAAALAGGLADALRGRLAWAPVAPGLGRGGPRSLALGALPLAVGLALGLASAPPALEPGPTVLCVQPAFEQRRKQVTGKPVEMFEEQLGLTARGLAAARAAGLGSPDLVAWGETMLHLRILGEGVAAGVEAGLAPPAWTGDRLDLETVDAWTRLERQWVHEALFGVGRGPGAGILPAGTSFLAGAETYVVDEREPAIRRRNDVVLWGPGGERLGIAGKVHLVPGAEALVGLERFGWVRAAAYAIADYVPDLLAHPRTVILELPRRAAAPSDDAEHDAEHDGGGGGRDGAAAALGGGADGPWRMGVTVCFDNAFDDPYTEPLRRTDETLDFHLVASNEAWYETSFEKDQMLAFTRLAAIQSGRAVLRVTNSGLTALVGPDGRVLRRLLVDGEDRMVAGWLRVEVPVPRERGPRAAVPLYVRTETLWLALWCLAPLALLALRPRRRPAVTGR